MNNIDIAIIIFFTILSTILWFWAIIDIAKSKFKSLRLNISILIVVLLFPIMGSLIYFKYKRKILNQEAREFNPKFNR
jgi:membrane protease YdiL (CAAX protease family)